MNKKLQVFVSSTYTDLIEERRVAVESILEAGHVPAGMELFNAGKLQMETIKKWIDDSDVYMLILGGRYGSIDEESGLSYTELEYRYALSKNMPVFAVVLSESYLVNKIHLLGLNRTIESELPDRYNHFKSIVMSKVIRYVDDYKDIKLAIHSTLNEIVNEYDFLNQNQSTDKKNNEDTINHNPLDSIHIPPKDDDVVVEPKQNNNDQISVFIIMPFSEEWSDDVLMAIKDTCNALNINVFRADELLGSYLIIDDIISSIKKSDIIIADITVRNTNVYYELGYAHALNKNTILVAQNGSIIPFDISGFRYITYGLNYIKIKKFQKELLDNIKSYLPK